MASQQAPPDEAQASLDPGEELTSLGLPWWRRYSPHGEFVWSSGISLLFHLFLVVLIIVIARPFARSEPRAPAVDSVSISDDDGQGDGSEGTGDGLPAATAATEHTPEPTDITPADLEKVEKVDPKEVVEVPSVQIADVGEKRIDEARVRISSAREALNRQVASKTKGGAGGSGTGGGSGRGGRAARWVLKFRTNSAADYLAQLEGLQATLAFELKSGKWRFFDHPSSDPGSYEDRGLDDENRLFWIDENRPAVQSVADVLHVSARDFMVAFLPTKLEQRMLELETSYQNRKEEDIASTVFEVARRGGKYDVMVIKQTLKE
jgi:hypothetical protein